MKKLIVLLLLLVSIPCFPALEKNRDLGGATFSHHWLASVSFNRYKEIVIAKYYIYKDAATKANNKHNYIKSIDVRIPFSAFTNTQLSNLKDLIETTTKRSIENEYEVETNWWYDASIVGE